MMILSRNVGIKSCQVAKSRYFLLSQRLLPAFSSGANQNTDRFYEKFDEILSFHDDVAAVREANNGGAYHIDRYGVPIYSDVRYKRTFGFYAAERAAVMDFEDKFFHIDLTGRPVYSDRYTWCGNFHKIPEKGLYRSPVRDDNNHYYYIDHCGVKKLGPFSYAGDPNSAGHSAVHDQNGNTRIIDVNGKDWCPTANERGILETCLPHKGIARVRDENGWFYINQAGQEVGHGQRYLIAEPHYNGQAKVRFRNGRWAVVDETGNVRVDLGESMRSSAAELEKISKGYMVPLALKQILENKVLHDLDSTTSRTVHNEILKDCASEMGLIRFIQSSETTSNQQAEVLHRGRLLLNRDDGGDTNSTYTVTRDRCSYWLQDRYLKSWLDSPKDIHKDTFEELADDPIAVEQSQRVLKSYADADWRGAGTVLSKLLQGANHGPDASHFGNTKSIRTVVDLGGGHGSLLRELQNSGVLTSAEEFVCVDRPEVVSSVVSSLDSKTNVKYEVGSLFEGPLQDGDLYLLSRVLHDWPNEKATTILDRLHTMSPEGARLCVIDRVKTPANLHALLSLHMFALQGSHERCHTSWKSLFSSSGWQIDDRENFNGHEMYLLTKDTNYPKRSRGYSNSDGAHNHERAMASELQEATGDMPLVRKAVVTVGGLATRMNPQSVVTPKALLPIISSTWKARPALTHLLDQFHYACRSIDQVYIVSTQQHIPLLKRFLENYHQTKPAVDGRKELAVQIITQKRSRGFGDAVLAARQSIGDEPFLLAIGDHIFPTLSVEQVLAAYQKMPSLLGSAVPDWEKNIALSGVTLCNESEVQHTGILKNQQSEYQVGTPWLVHEMAEKPRSNYGSFEYLGGGDVKYPSQLVRAYF